MTEQVWVTEQDKIEERKAFDELEPVYNCKIHQTKEDLSAIDGIAVRKGYIVALLEFKNSPTWYSDNPPKYRVIDKHKIDHGRTLSYLLKVPFLFLFRDSAGALWHYVDENQYFVVEEDFNRGRPGEKPGPVYRIPKYTFSRVRQKF
jgi:hypothetical protein